MARRSVVLVALVLTVSASALPAPAALLVRATDGLRFRPKAAEVAPGTRVTWRAGSLSHTVTAYGGGWSKNSTIAPGGTTRFRFTGSGTYRYRCRFHSTLVSGSCSGMCGKVVVG